MKAIVYECYGSPDVLSIREEPEPVATDGQVLIRVRAVEATKADCELRSFRFAVNWFWLPLRLVLGVRRPRRRILGSYFAGEIVAVGDAVTDLSVGDEVFGSTGLHMGAYGERVALPQTAALASKPENMTFAEAAAVPLGGLNALHFLRRARIQPGDRVLINGAGGSIGLHAVQIAKAMGAEVTGVDKGLKEAVVRSLGADRFVDYTREDFAADGARYDVLFDMVPGSSFRRCLSVLHKDGRYLSGNPRFTTMLRCLWTSWFSARTASFAFAPENREALMALREMAEAGQLRSIVEEVLPMARVADAHRRVEAETRMGALVLDMG